MRALLLAVSIVLLSGPTNADPLKQPPSPPADLSNPDHVFPAFGGQLIGTDRGEWGGALGFRRANGQIEVLLKTEWVGDPTLANVYGIIENPAGIFVFTGMTHLGVNGGSIYTVARGPDQKIQAKLMMKLSGAPRFVTKHPDGSTTFLVYMAYENDRRSYQCLVLSKSAVSPSRKCPEPKE